MCPVSSRLRSGHTRQTRDTRPRVGDISSITYDTSLKKWLLDSYYFRCRIICAKAHGRGIVAIAVHPTHDTLIIAKEEDRQSGYAVDENQESPLFILARDIVARDVVHDDGCRARGARRQ